MEKKKTVLDEYKGAMIYYIYGGLDSGGDASRPTTLLKITIHMYQTIIIIRE